MGHIYTDTKPKVMNPPLKIQAGKFYVDRTGDIVGPMESFDDSSEFSFRGRSKSDGQNCFFTERGSFQSHGISKFDLVSEHIDQAAECERLRALVTDLSAVLQSAVGGIVYLANVAQISDENRQSWVAWNDRALAAIARAETGK